MVIKVWSKVLRDRIHRLPNLTIGGTPFFNVLARSKVDISDFSRLLNRLRFETLSAATLPQTNGSGSPGLFNTMLLAIPSSLPLYCPDTRCCPHF